MGNAQRKKSHLPTPAQCQILHELQVKVTTPYSDASHEVLFRKIWKTFHPNGEPFEMVSAFWEDTLAFQGPDPRTDIRGGGLLSLENLVYFIETYPNVVMKMLPSVEEEDYVEEDHYPWAVAGINLTRKLCNIFHVVTPAGAKVDFTTARSSYYTLGVNSRQTFNELYCFAFQSLDQIWVETGATYMDFNSVIETTISRLTLLLEGGFNPVVVDRWATAVKEEEPHRV